MSSSGRARRRGAWVSRRARSNAGSVPDACRQSGSAAGSRCRRRRSPIRRRRRTPMMSSLSRMARDRRPIRRLLVANRGELVVRIARTGRSMGVVTVALVTDDQRDSWWARAADEVIRLPTSYLDGQAIIEAALQAGADAVHPGYGFLAERAEFAEAVIAAGLTWVGPPPSAMRALGDKAAARQLAIRVGVPVLQGYDGRGQSDAVLRREADRIGYPILVKPSAGGGGKGMHVIRAAGRPARDPRRGAARGDGGLRRRSPDPRAVPRSPASRRGPAPLRRAWQRHPPGRARLLAPAPAPEGGRGGAGARGRA